MHETTINKFGGEFLVTFRTRGATSLTFAMTERQLFYFGCCVQSAWSNINPALLSLAVLTARLLFA